MALAEFAHTGFHSDIQKGMDETGEAFLVKSYGHKTGGYEYDHAQSLKDSMSSFIAIAEDLGIPVVRPMEHTVTRNGSPDRYNLIEVVPYAGQDLRARFANRTLSRAEISQDIHSYLSLYNTVWSAGFPISLDPPPANFCKKEDGSLVYIDLMPPRQKLKTGEILSEWPQPLPENRAFIESRYFSFQQTEVIYPQLLRALEFTDFEPEEIKVMIGETLGEEAYQKIDFSLEQRGEILTDPLPSDVDKLRIFAAEDYARGLIDRERFHNVYHLTHIGVGGILPSTSDMRNAGGILLQSRGFRGYTFNQLGASLSS
jgi:hypothetical protein